MASHGEVMHIGELLARGAAASGASVRVLGTLVDIDRSATGATCPAHRAGHSACLTIAHAGSSLAVDTSLLDEVAVRLGELLQFIGEIDMGPPATLRARVMLHVDDLDVETFDCALREQRDFLADSRRAAAAGSPS